MMNFNPLFIGQSNPAGTISSSATKLGKSTYLFSDIIKVILEDDADMELNSDEVVTDLNGTDVLNFPNSFQSIQEPVHFNNTRLTSDFIELSPEEFQQVSETNDNDNLFKNEFELNTNDLQQLLFSLTGYQLKPETELSPAESESIKSIVNTVTNLDEGETLSIHIEGLEEHFQLDIKKNQDPLKEFTAKFNFTATESLPVSGVALAETADADNNFIGTQPVKELSNNKDDVSVNKLQPGNNPDFRVPNDVLQKTNSLLNEKPEEFKTSTNKTDEQPKTIVSPDFTPESNNTTVSNELKKDIYVPSSLNHPDNNQLDLKSSEQVKEFKTVTKPDPGTETFTHEQKDFKYAGKTEKTDQPVKSTIDLSSEKPSDLNTQTVDIKNIQHSDSQKVIRLTLSNSEQVNLRDVLTLINKGETKPKEIQLNRTLPLINNISPDNKTDNTTKLEQNQIRLQSKVILDEVNVSKPEIRFDKNTITVKEDSFAKLSGLSKPELVSKTFIKTDFTLVKPTSEPVKQNTPDVNNIVTKENNSNENPLTDIPVSKNPVTNTKPFAAFDKKSADINPSAKESFELKQNSNNIKTETNDIHPKEFVADEKKQVNTQPVKETSELKQNTKNIKTETNNINPKEIFAGDKKQVNVQPVKESSDLKQDLKNIKTETNDIPKKEFSIEDRKPLNVQQPVKESTEIKSHSKVFQTELNNSQDKDLSVNSLREESLQQDTGDEKNTNQFQQGQNQKQSGDNQTFISSPKNETVLPSANNSTEKPVKEPVDKQSKDKPVDETKIDVTQKPVVKESNIHSKEKIAIEIKHIPENIKTIRSTEIVKEISNFVKNGDTQTVTFKVVPESLGKIKVFLDVTDQIAKATIEVENESVKQIVQSNIETLKQSLTQSGITVNAINVSLTGNQQKNNRPVDVRKKVDENRNDAKIETENDTLVRKNFGYNTYEYLA